MVGTSDGTRLRLLFSSSSDTSTLDPARGVPISDGMSPISSGAVRYADSDSDGMVGNDAYDVGNDSYEDATDDGGRGTVVYSDSDELSPCDAVMN
jgi:hypothetical protein